MVSFIILVIIMVVIVLASNHWKIYMVEFGEWLMAILTAGATWALLFLLMVGSFAPAASNLSEPQRIYSLNDDYSTVLIIEHDNSGHNSVRFFDGQYQTISGNYSIVVDETIDYPYYIKDTFKLEFPWNLITFNIKTPSYTFYISDIKTIMYPNIIYAN